LLLLLSCSWLLPCELRYTTRSNECLSNECVAADDDDDDADDDDDDDDDNATDLINRTPTH
jgi:hypothetical protein